jgi:hypothetical protein
MKYYLEKREMAYGSVQSQRRIDGATGFVAGENIKF